MDQTANSISSREERSIGDAAGHAAMRLHHYIGGQKVMPAHSRFGEVCDPSTGKVSAHVPLADAMLVNDAVDAASSAFPAWSDTPAPRRARVMFALRDLLERHRDELAILITAEHGKVLADARDSIQRGIEVVEFACGIPHLLKGEFSEQVGRDVDAWSTRQPLGVCVGITPFNFPAMVPLWMIPIALSCGNTFILKPSEKVPSCALRLAELLTEAGLPRGVFNVLNGDAETAQALITHRGVAAVSFVGSTPVAERVYQAGTAAGKRVQALGGAKNHMVIMPDADSDGAADALMRASYGSAGERCMAISVAVAVGAAADPLLAQLKPRIDALRVGPGTDVGTEMGPLISAAHRDRVSTYIQAGVDEGAVLVADGRSLRQQGYERGFFLGPSLFDHVTSDMRIYKEEIFGPVLCVVRVDSLDEAIALTSGHPFGNGASIFTQDGDAARRFVSQVQIGMVGINVAIPVPTASMSFGGWKRSLFGDHHIYGMEGVRFYTHLKNVTGRWPTSRQGGGDFVMQSGN